MTTENTAATTQAKVELIEEVPAIESTEAPPAKIMLAYLLSSVERYSHCDFEEWAIDFYNEAQRRFAKAQTRLWTMERLGLAPEMLAAERTKLALWEAQTIKEQFLSCANSEEPDLDYTDPKVLKYFALWLWDTDHHEGPRADPSPYTYGPLDWALYLDDELLALKSFGLR